MLSLTCRGPELAFQRVPGVVQTAVGYSQGQTKNPSYQDVSALVSFCFVLFCFVWSRVLVEFGWTFGLEHSGLQPSGSLDLLHRAVSCSGVRQELGCTHGVAAPAASEWSASHASCLCLAALPPCLQVCSGTTGHAEVVQVVYDPTEVRSAGLRLFQQAVG